MARNAAHISDRVVELWLQGLNGAQISARLGRSPESIRLTIINRLGSYDHRGRKDVWAIHDDGGDSGRRVKPHFPDDINAGGRS